MSFTVGGYTLTGGTLGFDGTAPTVSVSTGTAAIASLLAGSAGLTKLGSGTLALSGANTFTGSLTVAAGALSINSWNNSSSNGPLGNSSTPVTLGSATSSGMLIYTGSNIRPPSTVRGINLAAGGGVIRMGGSGRDGGYVHINGSSITGSGPLTIDSPGMTRFLIVGSGSFTGPVTVQAGELQANVTSGATFTPFGVGTNGLGSAMTVNAGAILTVYSAANTPTILLGSLAGSGTVRRDSESTIVTLRIGGDDTSTTFSGRLQDAFAPVKVGAGTLTLSGSNSYTGATSVNAGVLALGTSTALAGGGNLSFGGGTLRFSAANTVDYSGRIKSSGSSVSIDTNSQSVTFGSSIDSTNTGGLTKLGAGTLTLSGSNSYTGSTRLGSGTLVVGNASALAASTLDMNSADSGSVTFSQDSTLGGLTGSRDLDMGTRTLSIGNNNQSTTYSGRLSNGGLTKLGSGTLTLSGSNSYTGATSVNAGVLALGTSTALAGGGNLSFGGGTLRFSAANTVDYSGRIKSSGSSVSIDTNSQSVTFGSSIDSTNTGGLTKLSSGTLTLSGSNSYSGNTTISGGRLTLSGNGVLGSGSYAGAIANAGELVIGSDVAQTLSGAITGTGSLTKSGAGTLTLSGASNFSGAVTINGGVVSVASWNNANTAGVWGGAGSLIAMNGARINYTGATASGNLRGVNLASGNNTIDVASGATLNFAASNSFQSNGGNLVKEGAGTLQLGSPAVANSIFTGKATINSGTLEWFGAGSMPSPASLVSDFLTINNGAAFALSYSDVGTSVSANIGIRLSGNATILSGTGSDASHTIAGPITDGATPGSLLKTGAGRLTLTGSNSFTGSTRSVSGTLTVGNASALAASTLDMNSADSGGVTFSQNSTLGGLSGSRNLDMGTRTLSIGNNNQSTTYSGGLSSGALTKIGTGALTLSGSNSYTGATRVAAGSLLVNGTLGATAVTVESGGLLGGSGVIGGSVSVLAGGTFSPGNSPGLLTSGPLSLAGTTLMEIDGLAPRGGIGGYDATDVTGLLTYGGSMLIDFGSGITSAFDNNTTFNLFDFTSWTGSFTSITTANDGSFYAGLTFANSGNNDRWTATKGTQTLEFTHSTGNLVIVPEPHAAVLAGCGVAAAAWGLSRRRRRGTNA